MKTIQYSTHKQTEKVTQHKERRQLYVKVLSVDLIIIRAYRNTVPYELLTGVLPGKKRKKTQATESGKKLEQPSRREERNGICLRRSRRCATRLTRKDTVLRSNALCVCNQAIKGQSLLRLTRQAAAKKAVAKWRSFGKHFRIV